MNIETIRYIINYFPNLLTEAEKLAIKHSSTSYKMNVSIHDYSNRRVQIAYEKGWLSTNPMVLDLLKDGYETFELNIVQRIMRETPEKVYFNNCPKCGQLARTPYSRQCRCGNQWHQIIKAKFLFESVLQIRDWGFFLIGKLANGKITIGNYIDLTPLGLNSKPKIERIEFVLKGQNEDLALGINELNHEQQVYLQKIGSFALPFDILNER